jgi:glycosyltransferase involved in cell wall biosynthesis
MTGFLSLVVVHYQIPREFPRTLRSLLPPYQLDLQPDEYEIIVIDNGSRSLPDVSTAREAGVAVDVISVEDPTPSPSRAVNIGLDAAMGKYIGVFVDGARMASPRLLRTALEAMTVSDRAVVGSRGRYLGPAFQRESMHDGYDQATEDALLDSIDWERNGYRLFDVSVFDESSGPSWFTPVAESNSLFMARHLWKELGGYSEEFTSPGGGFVNLDTWKRACELPGSVPILLAGEATFHQLHGGVATNSPKSSTAPMRAEYERLRRKSYTSPSHFRTWGAFHERPALRDLGIANRERKVMAKNYSLLRPTGTLPADPDVTALHRRVRFLYWRSRISLTLPIFRITRAARSAVRRMTGRVFRKIRRIGRVLRRPFAGRRGSPRSS